MAKRPVFIAIQPNEKEFVKKVDIEFNWHPGFSVSQKQKSINDLHKAFNKEYQNLKILEISSKATNSLGVSLSAFNLIYENNMTVENVFQASKVFEKGGPYLDLLEKSALEAKRDLRLRDSGELIYFQLKSEKWELEPKTLFYDWVYINSVHRNPNLSIQLIEYNAFTDIEFNPNKSHNCQAISAALYVSLYRNGLLEDALSSISSYKKIIEGFKGEENCTQLTFLNP